MSSRKGVYGYLTAGFRAAKTFLHSLIPSHYTGQPYKLVLIGQTGSGKTSFLNLLCNCEAVQALADSYDKSDLENLKEENDPALENPQVAGLMKSKTNCAKLYEVEVGDFKVGIIDTPGFGDTAGKAVDKENTKKIIEVLKDETYINCICFIINGTDARMTDSLEYVLNETTAILPKTVLDNVIVVFTRVSDPSLLIFKPECLASFFGREVRHLFCIDNPYSIYQNSKGKQLSSKAARILRDSFVDAPEKLKKLCDTIKEFPPVHTHEFALLCQKKQETEKGGLKLLKEYENQVELERQLAKAKKEVRNATEQVSLSSQVFSAPMFIQEGTENRNTICGAKGCNSNCHEGCSLPMLLDKTSLFRLGETFTWSGDCKVCKHSAICHFSTKTRFIKTQQGLVDEEVKKMFEDAKDEKERVKILEHGFESKTKECQEEKKRLSEQLLTNIVEFEKMHETGKPTAYATLIKEFLKVIETYLGPNAATDRDLGKTKKELEKRLKQVRRLNFIP